MQKFKNNPNVFWAIWCSELATVLAVFSLQRWAIPLSWGESWDCSGFPWHCSKWARQFLFGILQYTSGLEVWACSIDTVLNYYKIYSNGSFNWSEKKNVKLASQGFFWRYIFNIFRGLCTCGTPPGLCSRIMGASRFDKGYVTINELSTSNGLIDFQ